MQAEFQSTKTLVQGQVHLLILSQVLIVDIIIMIIIIINIIININTTIIIP